MKDDEEPNTVQKGQCAADARRPPTSETLSKWTSKSTDKGLDTLLALMPCRPCLSAPALVMFSCLIPKAKMVDRSSPLPRLCLWGLPHCLDTLSGQVNKLGPKGTCDCHVAQSRACSNADCLELMRGPGPLCVTF